MKIGQRGLALVVTHRGFTTALGRPVPESKTVRFIKAGDELDKGEFLRSMEGQQFYDEIHREALEVEYTGQDDWKFVK